MGFIKTGRRINEGDFIVIAEIIILKPNTSIVAMLISSVYIFLL